MHAVIPPADEHRQNLVLIGHIDTQCTPLIFRTPRWVAAYRAFTTVAFVLFAVQAVLYLLGSFFQWGWVWYATLSSAICAGPGWLTTEGIIIPFHYDPGLQKLVAGLARQHPERGAYPVKISGGNSELADCVRAAVPAITLLGLAPNGEAPYWHLVGNTCGKIDPEILRRLYAMAWAMIQEMDRMD